jgi:hypothetical protein
MNIRYLTIFIIIFTQIIFCQNKKLSTHIDLEGVWQSTLEGGYLYECPDIIEFLSDTEYAIYNDCDVIDLTNPLVEKRKFEVRNKTIFLYDREPVSKEL